MSTNVLFLEIIVDSCVDTGATLKAIQRTIQKAGEKGWKIDIRLTYTAELFREQTGHLGWSLVPQDIGELDKKIKKLIELFKSLGDHFVVLPADSESEDVRQKLLDLAKAVAKEHPDSKPFKYLLENSSLSTQAILTLENPSLEELQGIYSALVWGTKIKKAYPHAKTAVDAFIDQRRNSADRSIEGYIRDAHSDARTSEGQHWVTIFVSEDRQARHNVKEIGPATEREMIVTMKEKNFLDFLSSLAAALDGQEPSLYKDRDGILAHLMSSLSLNSRYP